LAHLSFELLGGMGLNLKLCLIFARVSLEPENLHGLCKVLEYILFQKKKKITIAIIYAMLY
jgi:hypothetical protein